MQEKTKKKLWGATAGLADPILREWAQKLASSIPEHSPLRSRALEAAIAVLKGFIEASADELPSGFWAAVEKATDFSDFFAGALGAKKDNFMVIADNWMKEFLDDAKNRLLKTRSRETELESIKTELELRKNLLEAIKKAEEEKNQPSSWIRETLEKFKKEWGEMEKKLQNTAKTLEKKSQEKRRKGGYRV